MPDAAAPYDVWVIGAGTAGMEAALSLGDMGYRVVVSEQAPSIGGKTILLSKVFPTLDCASCISTPKMAAVAHHPNVRLLVNHEIEAVEKTAGGFAARLRGRAVYVDPDKCTGCSQCETACTVAVPDQYNYGLVARRAAHIPFPQAIPKKAVIDRLGNAPCIDGCPASVPASGFVSLVRAGKTEEAFRLHLEHAPLVGALSRACYAPCEGKCTRGEYEGPVNIRAVKRFMTDAYYEKHPEPEYGRPPARRETRVAVVGSGPAGLTAAFYLARQGHSVTIFESEAEPGGMLRYGIPAYRLPKDVLARDIKNVTALGVEIRCHARVESIAALRAQGYQGVVVAVGGQMPRMVSIAGLDLVSHEDCMNFLRQCPRERPELRGRRVVVIGGGNVAVDVARSALRLGAAGVDVLSLESRDAMPAHAFEIREAEEEGVVFHPASATQRIFTENGETRIEFCEVESLQFTQGQAVIKTVACSERSLAAEIVIMAVGLGPSTQPFAAELALNPNRTVTADPETLATSAAGVFGAGDAVMGPSMIVKAVAQGKRAAHHLHLSLLGPDEEKPAWPDSPAVVEPEAVKLAAGDVTVRAPLAVPHRAARERVESFEAYEGALTAEQARAAANRCLDCAVCSQCQECVRVCPAYAVDFQLRPRTSEIAARAVIVAGGFEILDPAAKPLLGYGRYPNVISAPQMDRLLAPTRPYNGVLRPSDGREPERIAMVLCAGARDETVCNPLCCRMGCMYSIKQAQLVMGALPLAEVEIFYIDIRAFGKGYEEFFTQAQGMGVKFTKGRVARVTERPNGNLTVEYEDIAGGKGKQSAEFDLVVLSVGIQPNRELAGRLARLGLITDAQGFLAEAQPLGRPGMTTTEGVFLAGLPGGSDIPDTVVHASAAAAQAARWVETHRRQEAAR